MGSKHHSTKWKGKYISVISNWSAQLSFGGLPSLCYMILRHDYLSTFQHLTALPLV
jgi:hypothetical protein